MGITKAQFEESRVFGQKIFDYLEEKLKWRELCKAFCSVELNDEQIEYATKKHLYYIESLSCGASCETHPYSGRLHCMKLVQDLKQYRKENSSEGQLLSKLESELKNSDVTWKKIAALVQQAVDTIPIPTIFALQINSKPLLEHLIFSQKNDIAECFFDLALKQPEATQWGILYQLHPLHSILISTIIDRNNAFALYILKKLPELHERLLYPLLYSVETGELALLTFLLVQSKSEPQSINTDVISETFLALTKAMDDLGAYSLWNTFFSILNSGNYLNKLNPVFENRPDFALLLIDRLKKTIEHEGQENIKEHRFLRCWKERNPKVWSAIFTNEILLIYPDIVEWMYLWLPSKTASTIQRPNNDPEIAIHCIRLLKKHNDANTIDRVKQVLDWLSKKSSDDSATPAIKINYTLATFFLKWLEKNPTDAADFNEKLLKLLESITNFESTQRNPSQRLCYLHEVYSADIPEIHSLLEDALTTLAFTNKQNEALFGLLLINKKDETQRNCHIRSIFKIVTPNESLFWFKKTSSPLEWLKSPPKNDRFISDFSAEYTSKIEELLSEPNAAEVKSSGPGNIQGS